MKISYEDDSGFSANLFWDRVSFESSSPVSFNAVVAGLYLDHRKNPMQPTIIDGIIGLAYRTVSNANTLTPLDYLIQSHHSELDNVFALCLDSKTGGSMTIGSPTNDPFYKSLKDVQWSPLLKETYYPVNMTALYVGTQRIDVAPDVFVRGDAIVDSGSTDVTLPRTAYDALRTSIFALCNQGTDLIGICHDEQGHKIPSGQGLFAGLCYTLSEKEIAQFPTLYVRLGKDVSLPIEPSMYIRGGASYCDDKSQVGLAIDSGAVGDGTLLGDIFMQGFMTIFDRENKRIGFAPAADHC